MRIVRYALFITVGLTPFAPPEHSFRSADSAVGHFDLDVQKSKALFLGKSHVETVSAFVTYTDRFFGGGRMRSRFGSTRAQ